MGALLPAALLAGCTIALLINLLYKNVWTHPLGKVPGPFLAKLSHVYVFYFNFFKRGRLYLELERLHKIYGPIVRITPNEVSLSSPEDYTRIYHVNSKFYKDREYYKMFGTDSDAFTTGPNDLHKIRRRAMDPLFNRTSINELETVVQAKVDTFLERVQEKCFTANGINLHIGFRAVSVDVITDYAFDDCYNLLKQNDMGTEFCDMAQAQGPAIWLALQFPWLLPFLYLFPAWLAEKMSKPVGKLLSLRERCSDHIQEVQSDIKNGIKPNHKTIFHQLFETPEDAKGRVSLSLKELTDEAFILLKAAADPTGYVATRTVYHILSNPDIYKKLKSELRKLELSPADQQTKHISWRHLQQCDYLTACIREGLRISILGPSRVPRVVPDGGATFQGHYIPAGNNVTLNSYFMHRNPVLFPRPDRFDPDRWLPLGSSVASDKNLVAFGKDSRHCIGRPLAECEMYVTLGRLFRFYDVELKEVHSPEDLVYEDYFAPFDPVDAKKLHARVKPSAP